MTTGKTVPTQRLRIDKATEFGSAGSFWVEYPSGLVDLTRSQHLPADDSEVVEPPLTKEHFDIPVDDGQLVRINPATTAFIITDMQKYVQRLRYAGCI